MTFRIKLAVALLVPGIAAGQAAAQLDPVEVAQLLPGDILFEHRFGHGVAISGEFALVSALTDNTGNGVASGSVRVFQSVSGEWQEIQTLAGAHPFENFGDAVAISGDWALIGASSHDVDDLNAVGAAYFYEWDGTAWVNRQTILPDPIEENFHFGWHVAMADDVAVVTAWNSDTDNEAVFIYRRDGSTWEEEAAFHDTGTPLGGFGQSVAISEDFVLAGDDWNNVVAVFHRAGGEWEQEESIPVPSGSTVAFGFSVAVEGDVAVIGAPVSESNQGRAYVYRRTSGEWVLEETLLSDTLHEFAGFGYCVAISGPTIAVSATGGDDDPNGTVHLFRYSGGSWVEQPATLRPSQPEQTGAFGYSLDLHGSLVIVGVSHGGIQGAIADPTYIFDTQSGAIASIMEDFSIKRGELMAGSTGRLPDSDNKRLTIQSEFEPGADPPYTMIAIVKLRTTVENPSVLHVIVEGKLDQNDGTAKLLLYDWTLGKWKRIRTYAIGRTEAGELVLDLDGSRYVKASGLIKLRIRHEKVTSSNGDPFISSTDQVEVLVRD